MYQLVKRTTLTSLWHKIPNKSHFYLLVTISALLSVLRFHPNFSEGKHGSYSDISTLYFTRGLNAHTFPYSSATNSFEYPPIIGLGNWLISMVTPKVHGVSWFFGVNVLFIFLLFLWSANILRKMQPQFAHLFLVVPAGIISLFINWDMWAVLTALLATYYFDKEKYKVSAAWLGFSIATKFFPVVFLLPIAIIFHRKGNDKKFLQYISTTTLVWAIFNVPIMLTNFDGWFRFYELNFKRGPDIGSIYNAFYFLGHINNFTSTIYFPHLGFVYPILTLLLFFALALFLLRIRNTPPLAKIVFFAVVIFTTTGKVYSPQYILWLTPFALLALTNIRHQTAFFIWQFFEFTYHLSVFLYYTKFGVVTTSEISLLMYSISILLRIFSLSYFCYLLLSEHLIDSNES